MDDALTYPPIDTLKPVAEDVWIVDGPAIRFGPRFLKLPFSTRMTVVRLNGRDLFIHSPTPLADSLRASIDAIGMPRWIIGPNRIHYWWVPDWRSAYPGAAVYLAPRIKEQAKGRIDFAFKPLESRDGYPWDDTIATLPISGRYMTEVEFFHRPSRTLILTDLIENFEPQKLPSMWLRWLIRWAGVAHPNGGIPKDLRLTFAGRPELREAVRTMVGWQPERIILAHGKWYERDGTRELTRAFKWALE